MIRNYLARNSQHKPTKWLPTEICLDKFSLIIPAHTLNTECFKFTYWASGTIFIRASNPMRNSSFYFLQVFGEFLLYTHTCIHGTHPKNKGNRDFKSRFRSLKSSLEVTISLVFGECVYYVCIKWRAIDISLFIKVRVLFKENEKHAPKHTRCIPG